MNAIHISDALKEIDRCPFEFGADTFEIRFLKCNRSKKTGGQWVHLKKAQKTGLPYSCKDHDMKGIKDLESGRIIGVHNQLIFELNGMEIYK